MHKPRSSEQSDAPTVAERRMYARLRQRSLQSSLGPVLDLSRTGMRVRSSRRLRGVLEILLFPRSGTRLQVRVRVVWSKRIGFRKHLAGLEFVNPDPNVARELANIGTTDNFDM